GRARIHVEENFLSWLLGLGGAWSFADDNAVLSASLQQIADSFDQYDIRGARHGHVSRSSTNANLGITQLLSPTTVAHLDYGGTARSGAHAGPPWATGARAPPPSRWPCSSPPGGGSTRVPPTASTTRRA